MFVFFGAGKIGKKILEFCEVFDIKPAYFIDNNTGLYGKTVNGIEVVPVQRVLGNEYVVYMVTCFNSEPVVKQLLGYGVDEAHIVIASSELLVLDYIMKQDRFRSVIENYSYYIENSSSKILFDLSNGLALGGVETWSIQTAEWLKSIGYETCLMVTESKPQILTTDLDIVLLDREKGFKYNFETILQTGVRNIVINFAGYHLVLACILKKMFGSKIRLITVVHNDESGYYENYVSMQKYIDKCLVISKNIKGKLLQKGFMLEKCETLFWEMETPESLNRRYASADQMLRIGYAGRLSIVQKRTDLLLDVAQKLMNRNVPFQLEIAGTGDYLSEFLERVKELYPEGRVRYAGILSRDRIPGFWSEQDIMVTCSEYEGHSISQCEAMAQGTVPVVTDTSGARDDVVDGGNGFVVSVGDIDEIVEKICFLNEHRELLEIMGRKAYETIKSGNNKTKLRNLWERLLEYEI